MSDNQKMRQRNKTSRPSRREVGKVGKRGTFVLPAAMRRRLGLAEGSVVVAEERDDGILIRPAAVTAVEKYSTARVAEFLLNNAVDREDYDRAVQEVRAMGLDPKDVDHRKPRR